MSMLSTPSRKKLRSLFTASVFCLLAACQSSGNLQRGSTPPDQPKIDPSMLVRCDDLPGPSQWQDKVEKDGSISLGNFTLIYSQLQNQYTTCAIRNDCLIEAVKGDKKAAKSDKCITNNKDVK